MKKASLFDGGRPVTLHVPIRMAIDDDGVGEMRLHGSRSDRAEFLLASLAKGVALLDRQCSVRWFNPVFRSWCPEDPMGKPFLTVFGPSSIYCAGDPDLSHALTGKPLSFRLQHLGSFLDINIHPVLEENQVTELIALCDDVTDTVIRQQKLDALHQAGQELADLDPSQLSEMDVKGRVELLKKNLRRHIHDLLTYDVIEIRLLDPITGKLNPLLDEGMMPEAVDRVLYAREVGNGVTGYVAATGRSYLCLDTANDPHYIVGASGARCSMTVPILYQDQVIGTFNVESPSTNAFTEEDLQFAELFSRELARALHTLNLLSAQQVCTAHQSVDAINREIALPADALLNLASGLLSRLQGREPEFVDALQHIMSNARLIKNAIQKVGDSLSLTDSPTDMRSTRLKGTHILVIDSDEQVRRSSHLILERHGGQVETAVTGEEGLAMAQSGQYNAILTDIRHPDLRGTVVYRTLKALQPNGRVILTQAFGYDSEHTVVNARQDGYWLPILFKPFRVEHLLNALTCSPPAPKASTPV